MDYEGLYKRMGGLHQYILEVVDEYTLYCYYTKIDDLQLNKSYSSPFREDTFPSFGIYRTKYDIGVEYLWKDLATGESGNIFKLIQKIEQVNSNEEAYQIVNEDFGLGLDIGHSEPRTKINLYGKPKESLIKIQVAPVPLTEAGLSFWKQFDISTELLDRYYTTQIKWYWSFPGQQAPYNVGDPTFAYRIGKYYQVYNPFAPKLYKFRNDFPEHYFFGYMQLSNSGEKLIIDKSCKDVIFCRRLGYEAVCGKSETTMIPKQKMLEMRERFRVVYLMLDNDKAGITQAEKYLAEYPWLQVRFLTGYKDKTDMCKGIGVEETRKVIESLLT
jgi:hypothetical protein